MRRKVVVECLKTALGLFIFAFGVNMTIHANIGLAPWDALSTGVSYHTPWTYGVAHTFISLLILAADICMKEKIGYGTVMDALLTGNFVDFFTFLKVIPDQHHIITGIAVLAAGLFVMAFGQYIYMKAGLGCGPRDSFLVGIGKRMSKIPIGIVNTMIMCIVLFGGWILGAPIGIGTIISTMGIGTAMQIVFRIFRFEPREITHKNCIETTWIFIENKAIRL